MRASCAPRRWRCKQCRIHLRRSARWAPECLRLLAIHVLPNVLGPLLILASMDVPLVIATEAGLSFLGMGVRPPTPSWGDDPQRRLQFHPQLALAGHRRVDPDHPRDAGLHLHRRGPARHLRPQAQKGPLMVSTALNAATADGSGAASDALVSIEGLSVDFGTAARRGSMRCAASTWRCHGPQGAWGWWANPAAASPRWPIRLIGLLAENARVAGGAIRMARSGSDPA